MSSRDKKLLLYAGGVLVLLLTYFFVFNKVKEKVDVLASENANLLTRYQELQILDANKAQYQKDIVAMNDGITEVLAHFPVAVKEEDSIMYAVKLEQDTDAEINAINISTEELLYTSSIPTSSSAIKQTDENAAGVATLNMFNTNSLYSFTSSYEGFKNMVKIIQNDSDVKNVDALSLAYDSESGLLIGTMSVNMFAVEGTGYEYREPEIPAMSIGVDNIFGTVTPAKNREQQIEE